MSATKDSKNFLQAMRLGVMAILLLVPFTALFTTWAGSNLGHLDLFRIWKELLMIPLVIGAMYLVFNDKRLWKWFASSKIVGLIAICVFLNILLGVIALAASKVNTNALIYALLVNTRFLLFFLVCVVVAYKTKITQLTITTVVVVPAAIVIIFGLFQHYVLPNNFLEHFGYSQSTIQPFQAVDKKPEYIRAQSTLRGPNPLGAYLVLALPLIFLVSTKSKKRALIAALLTAGVVVMYFTYSRSAWVGLAITSGLIVFWSLKKPNQKGVFLAVVLVGAVLVSSAVFAYRQNNLLENALFHTDETSNSSVSSNEARTQALQTASREVMNEPLGRGPGTAGPASVRNNHPARISEDYYLQIGQEIGIIGLVVFILIVAYVAQLLWLNRSDNFSLFLLAILAGLSVVNLVSHAWTDDTISYLWWGLAGIALTPAILKSRTKNV